MNISRNSRRDFVLDDQCTESTEQISKNCEDTGEHCGTREQIGDTDHETQEFLYSLLRSLSPEQRLSRMLNLCTFGRQMMLEDIKNKHHEATDPELRRLFALRLWGESFVHRYIDNCK